MLRTFFHASKLSFFAGSEKNLQIALLCFALLCLKLATRDRAPKEIFWLVFHIVKTFAQT